MTKPGKFNSAFRKSPVLLVTMCVAFPANASSIIKNRAYGYRNLDTDHISPQPCRDEVVETGWDVTSGFDNLQEEVFCDGREVLVIVQQPSMMLECRSSDNAVVGLAEGNTRLAQFAVDVRCVYKHSVRHGQH